MLPKSKMRAFFITFSKCSWVWSTFRALYHKFWVLQIRLKCENTLLGVGSIIFLRNLSGLLSCILHLVFRFRWQQQQPRMPGKLQPTFVNWTQKYVFWWISKRRVNEVPLTSLEPRLTQANPGSLTFRFLRALNSPATGQCYLAMLKSRWIPNETWTISEPNLDMMNKSMTLFPSP